jgi:hypothetical protein
MGKILSDRSSDCKTGDRLYKSGGERAIAMIDYKTGEILSEFG